MRTYTFEIYGVDGFVLQQRHKVITVEADCLFDAMKLFRDQHDPDWEIYQICRPFKDCSLPQPVWDYFNGRLLPIDVERCAEEWANAFQ